MVSGDGFGGGERAQRAAAGPPQQEALMPLQTLLPAIGNSRRQPAPLESRDLSANAADRQPPPQHHVSACPRLCQCCRNAEPSRAAGCSGLAAPSQLAPPPPPPQRAQATGGTGCWHLPFAESRFNDGCRGGCLSVEDKQAVGTLSDGSAGFRQDAAAAVAQMLGAGASALVEISVKCKGLPDRDVLR